MNWKRDAYVVVKNAIPRELRESFAREYRKLRDRDLAVDSEEERVKNRYARGDNQSPQSFSMYGFSHAENLLETLRPMIEKKTGLTVLPTYSYTRIYYTDAQLEPHRDRAACEISLTCCIDRDSTDWPICLENRRGETVEVVQEPGDIVIYSGCELLHWRDPYTGLEQMQTFLHYVNANGPNADWKYDRRSALNTPPLF